MAEVVLFHHVQGLTDGVRAFAGELRAGGHTVHTPDLFYGQRPATTGDGIDADPYFAVEGDLEGARELVATVGLTSSRGAQVPAAPAAA